MLEKIRGQESECYFEYGFDDSEKSSFETD